MGGGEFVVIRCEFREVGKLSIFIHFFSVKNFTNLSAKSWGDLLMGASSLVVCVRHHQGLAIIFGGCGDYPEFLR